MRKSALLSKVAYGALVLVPFLPSALAAQQAASEDTQRISLEEITVTAERRQQSLQEVPVAVSAFTELELERRQIKEPLDLVRFVPNMVGHNNTGLGTANVYSIRGLNNTESIATFDPPVGTYVDDVYITRQNANNFQFFDVERVEVLRGPQGTLFGRNTTGGAVNVILKKPGEELTGYAEASYGRFERFTARASVDLPINDKILTKLSAYYIDSEGYVDNLTTGETLNGEESTGVRGAVRLVLSENAVWDLSADYIDTKRLSILNSYDEDLGRRVAFTGSSKNAAPLVGLVSGDKQNFPLGNQVESISLNSTLTVDTDIGTITSITGYRDMSQEFNIDFFDFPTPTGGFVIVNDGEHRQFSQEIKIAGSLFQGSLDYVAGVFYLNENNTTDFADIFNFGTPLVLIDRTLKNGTETGAAFAQFDYHVTDALTATAGIRYTVETKDIAYLANNNPLALSAFDTGDIAALNIPTKQTAKLWTPRFALEYDFNDDIMGFVSATRGFKSGGWNARGTSALLIQPFAPEKVWSYESGLRTEWFDNRLRVNVTAFYTDVTDFQLPAAFETPTGITFITNNFADLRTYGLEIDFNAVVTAGLNVYGSLGLMSDKYTNLDPSIAQQQQDCLNGDVSQCGLGIVNPVGEIADPVRTPAVTASFGMNYEIALTDNLNLVPNAAIFYTAKQNVGTAGLEIAQTGDYVMANASLSLEESTGAWSVSAECTNCFGKRYVHSILAGTQYLNDPGTWTLRARYNF